MDMKGDYHFKPGIRNDEIRFFEQKWSGSLTRPQDGMWNSIRSNSTYWEVRKSERLMGYTCVNSENVLLQFYLLPKFLSEGLKIFKEYITHTGIKKGIVGTNNPIYLSLALHDVEDVKIHTYLFSDNVEVNLEKKEGNLKKCQEKDTEVIIDFCHQSVGAPKEWLAGYISRLINKGEVFVLGKGEEIIGTCEIRESRSAPEFADLGMIVSPKFRKRGYGTYLLSEAKRIAKERGKEPICSCEIENMGSLKSIQKCGFVSLYQLLSITFS